MGVVLECPDDEGHDSPIELGLSLRIGVLAMLEIKLFEGALLVEVI